MPGRARPAGSGKSRAGKGLPGRPARPVTRQSRHRAHERPRAARSADEPVALEQDLGLAGLADAAALGPLDLERAAVAHGLARGGPSGR